MIGQYATYDATTTYAHMNYTEFSMWGYSLSRNLVLLADFPLLLSAQLHQIEEAASLPHSLDPSLSQSRLYSRPRS